MRNFERALHLALIDHLHWRVRPDVWWTHFPAGGARSKITGALLKAMGTKPGVPDLLFLVKGRLCGLELKVAKGRLSPQQRATHDAMRAAGATIATAHTIDEALAVLRGWGIIT